MALENIPLNFGTDPDSLSYSESINWGTPDNESSCSASPDAYFEDLWDDDAYRKDSPLAELTCDGPAETANEGTQMVLAESLQETAAPAPMTDSRGRSSAPSPEAQPLVRPPHLNGTEREAEQQDRPSDKSCDLGRTLHNPIIVEDDPCDNVWGNFETGLSFDALIKGEWGRLSKALTHFTSISDQPRSGRISRSTPKGRSLSDRHPPSGCRSYLQARLKLVRDISKRANTFSSCIQGYEMMLSGMSKHEEKELLSLE